MASQPNLFSDYPGEDNEYPIIEKEGPLENIEDVDSIASALVSQAVVSANDWTTETIISQINKGNIILDPAFQRRDAWKDERKSAYIESLILGLPVPQLVLAESKARKGSYLVIDGKQRLLSIRQFAALSTDKDFKQLKLSSLTVKSDLNHLSLADLRADTKYLDDLTSFENQPIRTVVIKNWPNEAFLYQVFLRLNTGSVPLSPQELRQALHPGPFINFADEQSGQSAALRQLLRLSKPDFRMRDTELFIRYYGFTWFLSEYRGNLKGFLDLTCQRLNQDWSANSQAIKDHANDLESAYDIATHIFGINNVFRKWTGRNYERPINRAIFDMMMYGFSDRSSQQIIIDNGNRVVEMFKALCERDNNFLSSIERTTKSMDATYTRFHTWNSVLNDNIGTTLHVPTLVMGRLA
jgi:hypothetical protein